MKDLRELVNQRAEDCQGILLGRSSPGSTEVRACRPVGGASLEPLRHAAAAGGSEIVGFYRIRSDDPAALTPEELALAEATFAGSESIVLLIRRCPVEPQATFFFRDDRSFLNVPLLSLPLHASALDPRHGEEMQSAGTAVLGSAAVPAPAPDRRELQPAPRPRASAAVVLTGGVILLASIVAGGVFLRNQYARPSSALATTQPQANVPETPLGLRAERQGSDVKIVWDLQAPAVAHAVSGSLSIEDNGARRIIPLDAGQIRFGSLLYTPLSGEVAVHLTAVEEDGTAAEASVLVITGEPGRTQALAMGRSVGGAQREALGTPASSGESAANPPAGRPTAAKTFVPPPSRPNVQSLAAAEDLPDARFRPTAVTGPTLQTPLPPPPASAAPVAAPARPRPAAPPPAPEKFEPAVLERDAGVSLPLDLRGLLIRPIVVSVRATVDPSGRVTRTAAIPQAGVYKAFFQAAEAAATKCRFRPARRNGVPVASEVVINFRIQPAAGG